MITMTVYHTDGREEVVAPYFPEMMAFIVGPDRVWY